MCVSVCVCDVHFTLWCVIHMFIHSYRMILHVVWICHVLFILSTVGRHLATFSVGAIASGAPMIISVLLVLNICSRLLITRHAYVQFGRHCETTSQPINIPFKKVCASLEFCFSSASSIFFSHYFSHSLTFVSRIMWQKGFLHSSDDSWGWTSSSSPDIAHLHILSHSVSYQGLTHFPIWLHSFILKICKKCIGLVQTTICFMHGGGAPGA